MFFFRSKFLISDIYFQIQVSNVFIYLSHVIWPSCLPNSCVSSRSMGNCRTASAEARWGMPWKGQPQSEERFTRLIWWAALSSFFFGILLFQDEPNCTLSNPRKLSDFALDVFYSSKNCIWFAWRISTLLCMKLEFGIKWLMSTEMSLNWWVLHAKRDLSFAICQDWDFKKRGNLNSRLSGTIVVPWIFLITASCLKKLEFVSDVCNFAMAFPCPFRGMENSFWTSHPESMFAEVVELMALLGSKFGPVACDNFNPPKVERATWHSNMSPWLGNPRTTKWAFKWNNHLESRNGRCSIGVWWPQCIHLFLDYQRIW